ncbi:androgen-induced gene 1 protein-like [Lucilia sericata]|uniref:androgen-induced gene 1 protein-like n=1 Tax=Lucilia sericata TaxID=13632 RepID=UPI0018A80818|nr:androgen-induced gene 1 protein-like [Lucilia sericata]
MILQLVFHLMALAVTVLGIFYDFNYIKFPVSDFQWHHKFGGKFKFLSIQNMFIQLGYFLTALIRDIMTGCVNKELIKSLTTFKDNYFAGLAFPLAIFVSINFWVLYLTKRDVIFPESLVAVVPYWHLHVLHTNVTLLMFLEMFLCFREYPEFCSGLITILSYILSYILWLHCIKYFTGFWVYPLLNDKSFKELYTYFGSALGQVVIIYMLGEILNNAVWSYELIHKECVRCL